MNQTGTETAQVIESTVLKSLSYYHPKSQRQFRIELVSDLLGDWVVTTYGKAKREINTFTELDQARVFLAREHFQKTERGYLRF